MRNVNRVIMIGNLASDPEIKQTKTGSSLASFSLATNRSYKSKDGEKKDEVNFHRIKVWGHLVQVCQDYLKKGLPIYLEGRISNGQYESNGEKKYFSEIIADTVNILTSKSVEA